MTRLKYKELKDYKKQWLLLNDSCPICKQSIDDGVLDYCEETGHIRGVIHKSCNRFRNRLLKVNVRPKDYKTIFGLTVEAYELVSKTVDYNPYLFWKWLEDYHEGDYSDNPQHPEFFKKSKR